jgi:beta-ribofuranosylaminobenzene 5'-phosphate synthase
MTGPRLLVRTPSRLHFGLLGWGPEAGRQFGGLGLMIESPAIELTVEPAPSLVVQGPLADRVQRIVGNLQDRLAAGGLPPRPVSIRIIEAPPEHIGLGVGTQLSLAIAAALLRLAGAPVPTAEELGRLTGRGRRSGIGLHGFHHGGFLVDGGRRADGDIPPLIARSPFPEDWSVLFVRPPGSRGLHGPEEVRAFAELPPIGEPRTERLCRIVLLGILPAIAERDLSGFGSALEELQEQVGASFAPAQGGLYSSPRAGDVIRELHRAGFVGCGQTSWGPSLYGFSDRSRTEISERMDALRRCLGLDPDALIVTRASNRGASIVSLE